MRPADCREGFQLCDHQFADRIGPRGRWHAAPAPVVVVANALEMLLSSEPIDCDEAFRIGLINRQTEKGEALDEALKFAQLMAERAPLSLSLIKKAVYGGIEMDLATALSHETFIVTTIYGTRDKKEGVSAFLEKRPARFTGE